jgi:putative ABC transport system permease protein
VIISEATTYALYTQLMAIEYQFSIGTFISIPIIGAFFVGAAGFMGVRQVLNKPPLQVLREL